MAVCPIIVHFSTWRARSMYDVHVNLHVQPCALRMRRNNWRERPAFSLCSRVIDISLRSSRCLRKSGRARGGRRQNFLPLPLSSPPSRFSSFSLIPTPLDPVSSLASRERVEKKAREGGMAEWGRRRPILL